MTDTKKGNATVVGVGVAACAVCCAGPILGFLAAIGLGTAVGFAVFGTIAVVLGAAAIAVVLARRRSTRCLPTVPAGQVPVELTIGSPRASTVGARGGLSDADQ